MGYYSTLYLDCTIKDVEKLKGFLAEIKLKIASDIAEDWEQELDLLYLDEDNNLACDDYYAKWYSDEKWIAKIAPFISEGEIEFIGEDSERWGYLIEKGNAYFAIYEKSKGEQLTE
ncbi:MAG: hypothetical protein Q7J16_10375 [Candidatus Cloacimonadales bacterium]|nr:hypothetical protein [Candidatus Cloacimonadales bacterium]